MVFGLVAHMSHKVDTSSGEELAASTLGKDRGARRGQAGTCPEESL
jgi:hypothetical protein